MFRINRNKVGDFEATFVGADASEWVIREEGIGFTATCTDGPHETRMFASYHEAITYAQETADKAATWDHIAQAIEEFAEREGTQEVRKDRAFVSGRVPR